MATKISSSERKAPVPARRGATRSAGNGRAGRSAPKSVLGRTVAVFEAFAGDRQEFRLGELAELTGLPPSTVHRIVGQLVEARWLEREGKRYRLGMRVFELGELVARRSLLRELALPFMEDLYEATHETIHMAVLDGLEVLYLEKIAGHRLATGLSRVGGRLPAHCTGVGKVLLAYADDRLVEDLFASELRPMTGRTITAMEMLRTELGVIRRDGVAYDWGESAPQIRCVAAPVFDKDGKAVAALSVTGLAGRFDPEQVALSVKTAARSLGRALAERGTPAHYGRVRRISAEDRVGL